MRHDRTTDFEFDQAGRVFTCNVEASPATGGDAWWWFRVSTERSPQRYAPFRHVASESLADVQCRIVAYYDDLLARRAMPAVSYWRRGRPPAERKADA
ncbi:MAG TPA: hypothetical protein VFZ21_25825 [Gemmatimonadaceae bacterium]|jgi:hypothetical protein|nr:hypothetical protein [Gemmatimonadaceae bacterium]